MKNIFHHCISIDLVMGTEAKSTVKSINNGGFGIVRQITDAGDLKVYRGITALLLICVNESFSGRFFNNGILIVLFFLIP